MESLNDKSKTKKTLETKTKIENKKENQLLNILLNVIIPSIILIKLSNENYLGPFYGIIIALSFPIIYGIYNFFIRHDVNILSIFGFVSVLLTGSISLFELSKTILIIKETSIPLLIVVFMIIFKKRTNKFIKNLLCEIFNFEKIEKKIGKKKLTKNIANLSKLMKYPFLASAILNFILAFVLIKSEPGTIAYNTQIGTMTALSFPVIAIPSMIFTMIIILLFIKKTKKDTGYKMEELMKNQEKN